MNLSGTFDASSMNLSIGGSDCCFKLLVYLQLVLSALSVCVLRSQNMQSRARMLRGPDARGFGMYQRAS